MLLDVREVKKQYHNPEGTETLEVLRGVSFQVDAGESEGFDSSPESLAT